MNNLVGLAQVAGQFAFRLRFMSRQRTLVELPLVRGLRWFQTPTSGP